MHETTKFHLLRNNTRQKSEPFLLIHHSNQGSMTSRNKTECRQEKSKTVSQSTFYKSPLLKESQLDQIEQLRHMKKNDFYGQMNSCDPYIYPQNLDCLSPKIMIPQAKVVLPNLDKAVPLQQFSQNLTKRIPKDKIHRRIPMKHDIQALAEWTDMMLRNVVEKHQGQSAQMYDEIQQIFTLCLQELIRQISFDCIEKSVLLEKIWNQYVEINTSVYEQILSHQRAQEKEHLSQVIKTHQSYQIEIEKYLVIVKNQKQDTEKVVARLLKVKESARYIRKNNKSLYQQIKVLKNDITELKNENKQYIVQLDKITDDLQEYQKNVTQQFNEMMQDNKVQNNTLDIGKRKVTRAVTQKQLTINSISQIKLPEVKPIPRTSIIQTIKPTIQDVLKDSSDSETDVEMLLLEKGVDTQDINKILQLTKDGDSQTTEKVQTVTQQKFEYKDKRQQIIQTELSYNNFRSKGTQTIFSDELLQSIRLEEQHLHQLQESLEQFNINSSQNQIETQLITQIDQFSKLIKSNLHKQKEMRTNLILVNSTFKDENIRKEEQIQKNTKTINELEINYENSQQIINELEAQINIYEKMNQKIEKKYRKLKGKKNNIVDKTSTLVTQLTQTHKFTEIMKRRIQEKRNSTLAPIQQMIKSRPAGLNSSSSPQVQLPSNLERRDSLETNLSIIPEKIKKTVSRRNITTPSMQSDKQAGSQHTIITNQFEDDENLRSKLSSSKLKQKTSNQNKKLIKKPTKTQEENEQAQFFQETITNFIQANLSSSSEEDSDDSEYNVKLEEIKVRKQQISQSKSKPQQLYLQKQFIEKNTNIPDITQFSIKFANQKDVIGKIKKNNLLKQIEQFYSFYKENQNKSQSLHIFIYEHFFNTYGFKNVADQKIYNFYESIYAHRDNIRINLFGRFLQLFSALTGDDLEIYLRTIQTFDNQLIHTDKGVFMEVNQAIQSLQSMHTQITEEYKKNIISDIQMNYIERDLKPFIDFDYYMTRILTGYQILKMMHLTHYQEVFYSADMDLDNMMEYQEFKKLFYYFETKQGNTKTILERQFISRCDLIASGERAMSFDRFLTFSIEQNLFSEEKYHNFANSVDDLDPIKTLDDLIKYWKQVKSRLLERITYAEEDELEYFQSIIVKIDQAQLTNNIRQSIWISYRIIDLESRHLLINAIIKQLIPEAFNEIGLLDDNKSDDI